MKIKEREKFIEEIYPSLSFYILSSHGKSQDHLIELFYDLISSHQYHNEDDTQFEDKVEEIKKYILESKLVTIQMDYIYPIICKTDFLNTTKSSEKNVCVKSKREKNHYKPYPLSNVDIKRLPVSGDLGKKVFEEIDESGWKEIQTNGFTLVKPKGANVVGSFGTIEIKGRWVLKLFTNPKAEKKYMNKKRLVSK